MSKTVELEISEWGRPIIYIADWYYKCLPGTAADHISNQCVFSTREEAIRWAKFEMRDEIDWKVWQPTTDDYPFLKNSDKVGLDPTFVATIEREVIIGDKSAGKILKRVTVHRTEVCGVFDWWAKSADGDWNKPGLADVSDEARKLAKANAKWHTRWGQDSR